MRLALVPVKPKRNLFDYRPYEREIREAMEDMGEVVKKSLEDVVADWDHKPDFSTRLTVRVGEILMDVYPTGPDKQIFIYVDQGTRPHVIRPRGGRRGLLIFQEGYVPRTTPGGGYGGPGKATGAWRGAPVVHHPGNAPRKFTAMVLNANKATFNAAIRDAIREAQQ